jgi:hypothetical protein
VLVVGYVREPTDPSLGRSAFSQQEQLRRYVTDRGHRLVAVCTDTRVPGQPPTRNGYRSLLGIVASGAVDAVLIPGIETFSSDAIVQEIILWDLRNRGVRVVSTESSDEVVLDPNLDLDPSRMVIRDVLERVEEHAGLTDQIDVPAPVPDGDVLVHIIAADAAEDMDSVR